LPKRAFDPSPVTPLSGEIAKFSRLGAVHNKTRNIFRNLIIPQKILRKFEKIP
jgi:hypothetical protein